MLSCTAEKHRAADSELRRRYRGDKEANDVGQTVNDKDQAFAHWSRLWDIYHNSQLLTTFKELMRRCGLKV